MITINEDVKVRWVDKLRSTPKENQGQGYYESEDGTQHCAVGVLRQMAKEEGHAFYRINDEWLDGNLSAITFGTLPSLRQSIAEANDAGVSWDIIADAIKNDL